MAKLHYTDYERVIAIKEMTRVNGSNSDLFLDTKSFDPETPIKDIIKWASNCTGRLIITIDETDAKFEPFK